MGRKKALCREWLTRGVWVAAAVGGVDGRAGVSGVLGRSFSRAGWAGLRAMQGWLAGRAGRARCEAFLLFFFCFIFLLYLNSNLVLEFEFKIGVPYSLEF